MNASYLFIFICNILQCIPFRSAIDSSNNRCRSAIQMADTQEYSEIHIRCTQINNNDLWSIYDLFKKVGTYANIDDHVAITLIIDINNS